MLPRVKVELNHKLEKGVAAVLVPFFLYLEKSPRVSVGYLGQDALEVGKACWGEQCVTRVLVVLLPSNA